MLRQLFRNKKSNENVLNSFHLTGIDFVNKVLSNAGASPLTQQQYDTLLKEVKTDKALAATYEKHLPYLHSIAPHKPIKSWQDRFDWAGGPKAIAVANIFYILPRVLRPTVAIETGVASGSVTAFLLAALSKNQHGMLYSIDLPPQKDVKNMDWSLPEDKEVGFLIPSEYKQHWSLIIGDATYELPKLFQTHEVDYFFHDSDHTFMHMIFEYSLAAKHLKAQRLIVSDDTRWNPAFDEFFRQVGYPVFFDTNNSQIGIAIVTDTSS
jgi:hypothetical protein